MDLSLNVRAVLSERLVPRASGSGRVAAFEIMLDSPLIKDLIFKGEVHGIKALVDLYHAATITYEDALRFADSQNEVRLSIELESGGRQPEEVRDRTDRHLV